MLTPLNFIGLLMFFFMWWQIRWRWVRGESPWHVTYFFVYMLVAIFLALEKA